MFSSWLSFSTAVEFKKRRGLILTEFDANSKVKMKILTFWYVACTIFGIYNLDNLVQESYEVTYQIRNQSEPEPIILACKELSAFQFNETEYELSHLRAHLYRQFKTSIHYHHWRELYPTQFEKLILNSIKRVNYIIFNGRFCFITKDRDESFQMSNFLFNPIFFAFKESIVNFVELTGQDDRFDQLVVLKKGRPYSNCSESTTQFHCLNDCFKRNLRLAKYFYWGSETGLIHLSTSVNRSVEESEKSCLGECQRENCKIVQFIPIYAYENRKSKTTTLKAHPKLSVFDFWVQLIGLVCSFAGISLNQLASIVIKFACSKVKRRKVRIALVCLRWTILLLSLTYCGYLYTTWIINHKTEEQNPPKREITRNDVKQNVVRLVICVEITSILNLNAWVFNLNSLNKTMSEIEKATDGALDKHLDCIDLNYQDRQFRVNYTSEPKTLFRYTNILHRCFSLFIRPDYQTMPSSPKLTIKFKNRLPLFLLTRNENFNEKSFEHTGRFALKKRMTKRLKSSGRCVDYQGKYGNCTSRMHCIESCINRKAFKVFKNIIFHEGHSLIIDKDQFSPADWKKAYPIKITSHSNRSTFNNLIKECSKEIADGKPCEEINFEKTVEIVQPDSNSIEVDLSLELELSIEEICWFNLLLNIMSIQTIFFSLTAFGLLRMLYDFTKPKLKIKNDKISRFFIYLLCSIGFTWHAYRILDLSINGELIYDLYYEVAKRVQMPIMVFCFPIHRKIDKNDKLTGNYLNQTEEATAEKVFQNIIYLNESRK